MNRIINDRKIFSGLVYWLESLLRVLPKYDLVHYLPVMNSPFYVWTEPPTKRRKISSSQETVSPGPQFDIEPGHFAWRGILICNIIAKLACPSTIDELNSTSAPGISTWNLEAAIAARIAGLSLDVIWTLPKTLRDHDEDQYMFLMQRIFSIWEQCCARDDTTSPEHRSRLFQQYLSVHFLFFRRVLADRRDADSLVAGLSVASDQNPHQNASKRRALISECIKSIERHVCVNTLLPLRKAIRAIKIRDWRSDRTAVTWVQVGKQIEYVREWAKEAHPVSSIGEVSPDFLSLAIRMMPDKSSTQYQQEILWLESFLLGLMYLSSPELPRMELDGEGCLRQRSSVTLEVTSESRASTKRLLQVAHRHKFIPSLPLLSYITSVVLEDPEVCGLQSPLTVLLELDADVMISNSGLNNSRHCFAELCNTIERADPINGNEYLALRDQIIVPLGKAFAQARDLSTFYQKWLHGLQAVFRSRKYFQEDEYRNEPLLVWQGEKLFAALSEIARDSGRPNLTREMFEQTIQSLESIKTRHTTDVDDALAKVAILDCLLMVRPGDAETLHLDLQKLFDALMSVSPFNFQHHSQDWRLWSLLRTTIANLQQESRDVLGANLKRFDLTPIIATNIDMYQFPYSRAAHLMEALQCFRLTAMLAHERRDFFTMKNRIIEEVEALIFLYSEPDETRLHDSKELSRPRTPWDGRWLHLGRSQDLIDGCIGVLLEYPNCFQVCSDLTPILVSKIGIHARDETKHDRDMHARRRYRHPDAKSRIAKLASQRSAKIFDKALAIINTDAVSQNRSLYLECVKALIEVFNNESDPGQSSLLRQIPLHDLPKSLLQELAIDKRLFSVQPSEQIQMSEPVQSTPLETPIKTMEDPSSVLLTKAQLREILELTTKAIDHDREHAIADNFRSSDTENLGSTIAHSVRAATTLLRLNDAEFEKRPHLALRMSSWAALQHVHTATNGEELCVMLDVCKLALTRRPKLVNQATVDDLLTMLAILTSESYFHVKALKEVASATIFDRLTGIIAILLNRFRRRLQSRYHLLLPCLQNLLQCLYFPGTEIIESRKQQNEHQLEFLDHLPSWLTSTSQPLSPASAAKFSRLLTSICDPTASAAARISSNTSELNDATKKARSIAGQYMRYLIMEYAYCTLSGQTGSPAVTARLMPGLYACLDCMPRELVGCMNDAMDPSSRAVFKGLWEDYGKFGKWDKR